jgi:hypothetical protein
MRYLFENISVFNKSIYKQTLFAFQNPHPLIVAKTNGLKHGLLRKGFSGWNCKTDYFLFFISRYLGELINGFETYSPFGYPCGAFPIVFDSISDTWICRRSTRFLYSSKGNFGSESLGGSGLNPNNFGFSNSR